MTKEPVREPNAAQLAQIDATWQQYRRLVIGLKGLWGDVLAVHLTVEAELENRLRILIPHPEKLLERSGFDQKITLFQALLPGVAPFESQNFQNIRRLNKIRNCIAHGDDDLVIANAVHDLLCQTSERYRKSQANHDDAVEGLRSLCMSFCGYIVGLTEGDAFEGLRKIELER